MSSNCDRIDEVNVFEQILAEEAHKRTLEVYWEQTREERDLKRHLKEMYAW